MKKIPSIVCVALLSLFSAVIIGCSHKSVNVTNAKISTPAYDHTEVNSIYYWKTVLSLDSADRAFLTDHNVDRAYIRFFDVVADKSPVAVDPIIPDATLQVKDSFPVSQIVPTVYITVEALERMSGHENEWAKRIVDRVRNMCSYNDFGRLSELQFDCDWTATNAQLFFNLCKETKDILKENNARLSSTIRLHQLSQAAPPVDYGVLMLYNTGSFKNPGTKNSILSVEDVKPYLAKINSYPLHLDFAYPTYEWNLVFKDNIFYGILRTDNTLPSTLMKPKGLNIFEITRDTIIGSTILHPGDIIRKEDSQIETLKEVKKLIDTYFGADHHSNIIYHLDSNNLSKYSSDEINSLYQ